MAGMAMRMELTNKEITMIQSLKAQGYSIKQIAETVRCSRKTVNKHLGNPLPKNSISTPVSKREFNEARERICSMLNRLDIKT